MAAVAIEFTEEQLNYYRICYVVADIITEGLRSIFKQEWDNRYKATFGEWKDEPKNGMDFKNMESPGNQRRNAKLLATMINGDTAEWDCTMLFYAILYSDCIGHGLNLLIKSNVDNIRKFRNEEFAHMPNGSISDSDFQNAIGKVHAAFQGLGLSISKIQDIRNQTFFPTEERKRLLKIVDDLRQELQEKEEQRQALEDQLHRDTSSFCILPPKPSHDVASRDSEVAKIMQQLKQLKSINENKLSSLYISGNPGCGKSQLAGLVAELFFDEVKEIPCSTLFVMTLNAESYDTLLESYTSFARRLKCPEYAVTNTLNSKDLTTEKKITNLKSLISTKIELYNSWLLVVDNVTSISLVHSHLPESGNKQWAKGQLLITTQDTASIPLTNSFIKHISVSKGMKPRDASRFLAKLSGIDDSEKGKEVAQVLDFQPLALASAAIYVRQVRQNSTTSYFGWNDYLEKLNKGQRGSTETILAETNLSYPNSMSKATRLAVEKAMTSDKVIHHTFSLLSMCATTPLSLDIVIRYILNVDDKIQDKEIIAMKIQRCSLLLFEVKEEGGAYIRVHQIVSDVIDSLIRGFPTTQQLQTVNVAIMSFIQFVEDDLSIGWLDKDSLKYSKDLVPHLRTLISKNEHLFREGDTFQNPQSSVRNAQNYFVSFTKLGKMCLTHNAFDSAMKYFGLTLQFAQRIEEYNHDEYVAECYSNLAAVHKRLGDLQQAKEYYERALAIHLEKLGPDNLDVGTCYNNLGSVHDALGDLEKAKEYHERALAIRLEKLGPDNLDVGTSYNNLGVVHHNLGDLEKAKEYHERVLAIRLEKLGPDNLDVGTCYNNLGSVHDALGDLEKAKEYHERALAIRLEKLGPDNLDVGTSYNNLGVVHHNLGDLEKAKEYHERVLAIRLEKLGPDNLDVGMCYNNLGTVHRALGDLEKAKADHERALAIRLEKLGPDNLDVGTCYNNLGTVHYALGDLEKAKEYHERVLAIRLEKLGPDNLDVGMCYNNLGTVHRALGDLEKAKADHERALAIRLEKLGPDNLDVGTCYNNLGSVHRALGDLEKAKEYHERALAIRLEKLGPDNLDVGTCYNNLGSVHRALGDLEKAKEYHERALAIRLEKLGPDNLDVGTCYNNLGTVHYALGDLEKAKEYHERALAIRLEKLGPDNLDVGPYYNNLGSVHRALGDLEKAKEYHERALAIRLEKLGPDNLDVGTSYNNLGVVHHNLGDLEKAKEYHERALAILLEKLGPDHLDVAKYYNNLGVVHHDLGDLEKAIEFHGRAVAIRVEKLGAEHRDVSAGQRELTKLQQMTKGMSQKKACSSYS